MRKEIRAEKMNPPIGHYTDAVQFGNLLFLAGCGPTNSDLEVVGGDDAGAQARQVFENMRTVLEAAGASLQDVLKVTVYLTDINDRSKVEPVRAEYFGSARPASATIGVAELAVPEAKVEIQAIAGLPTDQ